MQVNITKSSRGSELYIEQFNSLGEILRHASENKSPRSSNGNDKSWAGTE